MTPNETAVKVREMIASNSPLKVATEAAWNRICDKIESRALAARPKPKVFEVHHQTQRARLALLEGVAAGRAPESAEVEALEAVGLA